MRKVFLFSLVLWFLPLLLLAQSSGISRERIHEAISYLASEGLEGRRPGTPGDKKAALYILDHFRRAGLRTSDPYGLQSFDVITGANPGSGNSLVINESSLIYGQDFVTLSFSGNMAAKAQLVFAGYGFRLQNDSIQWNDYDGMDVTGKWVLLFRGTPDPDNQNSPFLPLSSERDKVLVASDHGAAGVIFVNGPTFQEKDALMDMFFDRSPVSARIPVLQLSRAVAENIFKRNQWELGEAEKGMIESMQPASRVFNEWAEGNAEVMLTRTPTYNVIGLLPGTDPVLRNEYIVVGAHYDHLGMGGPGSGSRRPDHLAVHHGADDNASGVAGVIELAYQFGWLGQNKRSILFVAFGAEEMGLLGSRYFVEHPVVPLQQMVGMCNFDMIGRLKEDRAIMIGGTGTAREMEDMLSRLKDQHSLEITFSPEGFGASDHASFYAKDIPVLFITTGAHEDYHTPDDVTERVNVNGQVEVLQLAFEVLQEWMDLDQRLTFQESGPKSRPRHGRGYKITLGIMPDFAGAGGDGLRVDAVRPEGPAGLGGMMKGDLITAIEGKTVSNIYDYMGRLKSLESGQAITVDVLREGKPQVLIIQL